MAEKMRIMIEQKKEEQRIIREELLSRADKAAIGDFPDIEAKIRASLIEEGEDSSDKAVLKCVREFLRKYAEDLATGDALRIGNGSKTRGRDLDEKFILETNAVLPPKGCAGSIFDDVWEASSSSDTSRSNAVAKAKTVIEDTWKANRTMFDPSWTGFGGLNGGDTRFNPIHDIGSKFLVARDHQLLNTLLDAPTEDQIQKMNFFQCSTLFFWNTAHALKNLLLTDSLSLEISLGSITSLCRSIQDDQSTSRPKKFHRIFLSNIPDYIGMISVFTEVMPLLHRPSDGLSTFLQTNVLLNTGIWQSMSHYTFAATGIPSRNDMLRLMGVLRLTGEDIFSEQNQWTWAQKSSKMMVHATRDELTTWLHRVLLSALLPPVRDPWGACNEQCPTNVATFMRLCAFSVEELGYPPHWVGGILDEIATACRTTGVLKSKADIPSESPVTYSGATKIQKIDIGAFRLDILTQFELWKALLGELMVGSETTPSTKSANNIKKYRLALGKNGKYLTVGMGLPYSESASYGSRGKHSSLNLGLVLSKEKNPDGYDGRGYDTPFDYPQSPQLGKGKIRTKAMSTEGKVDFQILSCIAFNCDLVNQRHSIDFMMCETDFEKYKEHYIHLFRTDSWNQVGSVKADDLLRLKHAVLMDI